MLSPDIALVSFDWDKIYYPSNGVNILRLESLTSTYKLLFSAKEPQKVSSSICPGVLIFLVTPPGTVDWNIIKLHIEWLSLGYKFLFKGKIITYCCPLLKEI